MEDTLLTETRTAILKHLGELGYKKGSYENQPGAHAYWLKHGGGNKAPHTLDIHAHLQKRGEHQAKYADAYGALPNRIHHPAYTLHKQGDSLHVRFHKTKTDKAGIDEGRGSDMSNSTLSRVRNALREEEADSTFADSKKPKSKGEKKRGHITINPEIKPEKKDNHVTEMTNRRKSDAHHHSLVVDAEGGTRRFSTRHYTKNLVNALKRGGSSREQIITHLRRHKELRQMAREELVFEGWMRHGADHYTADVSDLHHHIASKKSVRCPRCRSSLFTGSLGFDHKERDREGEVTHWKHSCPKCKTSLTIFNDETQLSGLALQESRSALAMHNWRVASSHDATNVWTNPRHPDHKIYRFMGGRWAHYHGGRKIASSDEKAGDLHQWLSHFHSENRPLKEESLQEAGSILTKGGIQARIRAHYAQKPFRKEGRAAHGEGKDHTHNPYKLGTDVDERQKHVAWRKGWDYAESVKTGRIQPVKEESLLERVLNIAQRRRRAIAMRRAAPRISRGRALRAQRLADNPHLKARASRTARNVMRKRLAGQRGKNYANLATADKIMIDRLIEKKSAIINRIAQRILPRIRQREVQRLQSRRHGYRGVKSAKFTPIAAGMEYSNELIEAINLSLLAADEKAISALKEKALKYGIEVEILEQVFLRGLEASNKEDTEEKKQDAFNRVNSFIAGGEAAEIDDDLIETTDPEIEAKRLSDAARKHTEKAKTKEEHSAAHDAHRTAQQAYSNLLMTHRKTDTVATRDWVEASERHRSGAEYHGRENRKLAK